MTDREPTAKQWSQGIRDALQAAEAWQQRAEAAEAERDGLRRIGRALLAADERGQGVPWQEAMDALHKAVGMSQPNAADVRTHQGQAPDEATRDGATQHPVEYLDADKRCQTCGLDQANGVLGYCKHPDCPLAQPEQKNPYYEHLLEAAFARGECAGLEKAASWHSEIAKDLRAGGRMAAAARHEMHAEYIRALATEETDETT